MGKFLFLRYRPKCFQPITLQCFYSTVSPEQIKKIAWFFACWHKFTLIKSWSNVFWVDMAKNGRGQSGHLTLELTVSQEWVDIMNGYFACWCKFRKVKTYFKKFLRGRGQIWAWLFSSWDPKICCNPKNELMNWAVFCMLTVRQ